MEAAGLYASACNDNGTLGRYLTEDWSFCDRWRAIGGKVYVGIDIVLSHAGSHAHRGNLRKTLKLDVVDPTNEATMPIDATEIIPNLYMGGYPPEGTAVADAGFDVLVITAAESRSGGPLDMDRGGKHLDVETIFAPFWDQDAPVGVELHGVVLEAARLTAERVREGKRVLVTCGEGRNRSGLVTALAIHALTGWAGSKLIEHMRAKRVKSPPLLSNGGFRAIVEALPEAQPKAA